MQNEDMALQPQYHQRMDRRITAKKTTSMKTVKTATTTSTTVTAATIKKTAAITTTLNEK